MDDLMAFVWWVKFTMLKDGLLCGLITYDKLLPELQSDELDTIICNDVSRNFDIFLANYVDIQNIEGEQYEIQCDNTST